MIVNKLTVKNLVEFRRLSEQQKANFAKRLTVPKELIAIDSSGGDYWIRSLSGLSTSFKCKDNSIIKERLDSLINDYGTAKSNITKIMYQRNIEILQNYEDFDFSIWQPSFKLNFIAKSKLPLTIKDVSIKISPHHIFTYKENNEKKIGGILFVNWLDGFKTGDLGVFSDAIFRYLLVHYSADHKVEPAFCLTVDASTKHTVGYNQIITGEIPPLLDTTIDTLKKYLN